jgi:hypothetical protein
MDYFDQKTGKLLTEILMVRLISVENNIQNYFPNK